MILAKFIKNLQSLFTLVITILIAFLFYQFYLISPKSEANWNLESKTLPLFEISDTQVKVRNIRNFKYTDNKITEEKYEDRDFDLKKIEKVWLVTEPFSNFNPLSQFYLTFDFTGEKPVVINVEPRREAAETSGNADLFWSSVNKYELMYVWSNEQTAAANALNNTTSVYMYPLNLNKEDAQKLFLQFAQNSKAIETTPVFYNLVLKNFSNEFASAAATLKPELIASHCSVYASSFLTKYLYKLDLISNDAPFNDLVKKYDVTEIYLNDYNDPEFSKKIREYLKS